jgi:hypothetical protein
MSWRPRVIFDFEDIGLHRLNIHIPSRTEECAERHDEQYAEG